LPLTRQRGLPAVQNILRASRDARRGPGGGPNVGRIRTLHAPRATRDGRNITVTSVIGEPSCADATNEGWRVAFRAAT
jgi:hypothetical protein